MAGRSQLYGPSPPMCGVESCPLTNINLQCFLSIPAWIYLCMAPRFPRTRRLAQPVVMAVVDGVFAVFWLSAFAAQAAYNSANLCGGACGQSKAIVAMGFFVLLVAPFAPFSERYILIAVLDQPPL